MRIWTLHPKYLDAKGLVALWSEGLLARRVLQGRTRGYRHHPQLARFCSHPKPVVAIDSYLAAIYTEACCRGYAFDGTKIGRRRIAQLIPETTGQLAYEWDHFLSKLTVRDPKRHRALQGIGTPAAHPCFRIVRGGVRRWERRVR